MYTQPWGNGRLSCDIRINNILIPRTWFYTVGGGDDWYGKTYTILLKKMIMLLLVIFIEYNKSLFIIVENK